MPLFTFYPRRSDGSATVFETFECMDDTAALRRAQGVLSDHQSSVEVVVWQGERRVGLIQRAASPA